MRLLLVCLALAVFGGMPAGISAYPQDDAAKKEIKALESTWEQTLVIVDGKEQPIKAGSLLIFNREQFKTQFAGKEVFAGTFTVDPTKTPRTIVFMPTKPEGLFKGKKMLSIYEISGDELKMATTNSIDAPADFSGKVGKLQIFKKVK
jgi:uncharacterized protein (TIGR03067 family)